VNYTAVSDQYGISHQFDTEATCSFESVPHRNLGWISENGKNEDLPAVELEVNAVDGVDGPLVGSEHGS